MSEITELTAQYSQAVNMLVSQAFGYQPPHAFFDDFPVWNSDRVLRLGILVDEELVSHVGIQFTEIYDHLQKLHSVALIGAVATDEAHRRKGYSNQLLKDAIRRAEEKNCEWIFLWGSEHEFYEKLGFLLAGSQSRALIASLPNVVTHRYPNIKSGLTDQIFEYLVEQKNGIHLTAADRPWFFAHKTVKWLYLDNPFAFVAFERGMDLPHLIHEWGGDADQLKVLFSHVLSFDPQAQLLGRRDDLLQAGAEEIDLIEEFLCLARPSRASASWDEGFWISGLNAC